MSRRAAGFTLVELNLAVVFVAILVLAVALTIIAVSRSYERGVTLKSVNQVGREVTDQLRRDIAAAQPEQVVFENVGGVGRLCLGSVSYVYNSATLLNGTGTKVRDTTQGGNPAIRFARIDDVGGIWCQRSTPGGPFIKTQITSADNYTEVLQADIVPMAIHAMNASVFAQTVDANYPESLVSLRLTLGTNEVSTLNGTKCRPPTDPNQNFTNCAVRDFVTVVRVVGGSS